MIKCTFILNSTGKAFEPVRIVTANMHEGGIYGKQPSLKHLENGDLKFNVDYRRLYTTVTRHLWGLNDKFLKGGPYTVIDCL